MEARQIEKEEERERITKILNERLEIHDDSRKAAQEKLHDFCDGLRSQINAFEEKVNSELEEKFTAEDNRLQTALNGLRSSESESDISKNDSKSKDRAPCGPDLRNDHMGP